MNRKTGRYRYRYKHFPIQPTSDHRATLKNSFKYCVRFQPGKIVNIPGSIEQTPKRMQKILPSQYPEPLSKITKKIKTWTIPLRAGSKLQLQMGWNPCFCLAISSHKQHTTHISVQLCFGVSNLMIGNPSSRDKNETDKKVTATPGREKINNEWIWIWKRTNNGKSYLPLSTGYY